MNPPPRRDGTLLSKLTMPPAGGITSRGAPASIRATIVSRPPVVAGPPRASVCLPRSAVPWLVLAFVLGLTPSVGAKRVFRAGAYAMDVTPTNLPAVINGGFLERSATNVTDRLHARCLVLDDGRTRIAIAVVDSCMMPRELLDEAKRLARAGTGIPADRMLISATHTHSAPAAMGCLGCGVDVVYARGLPAKIAEGIARAAGNLAPGRIGWTVTNLWELTNCRRWIKRPDKVQDDPFGVKSVRAMMHPGYQNPDYIGPAGPIDPGLALLAVKSLDGRPLALLANYSMHYFGAAPVSADYFGRFAEGIGPLIGADDGPPAFVAMMSQGTSGDSHWMDYSRPAKKIALAQYAGAMTRAAADAFSQIRYHDHVTLAMAETPLRLRRRVADAARLAWARKIVSEMGDRLPKTLPEVYAREQLLLAAEPERELKLQALRIGGLGLTAIPNEVFALTGLKLKAQSPLQPTINIALANGSEGYLPPPEQHRLGGYTTWAARTAGLEPAAEPRIVETMLGLLEQVSGRPRRKVADTHGPYAKAVLAANPLAYWRLNEFNPPAACDATGYGHAATYDWEHGIAFHLPGVGNDVGSSFQPFRATAFSGPNQLNRAPHFAGGSLWAVLPELGANYTVMFWLWNGLDPRVRATTGIAFARAGERLGITGTAGEPDRLFFSPGGTGAPLTGKTVLRLRNWHHVTLVREGRRVAVFLDGKPELDGEVPASAGGATVFLGGRVEDGFTFEGRLDEAAVFDRALNARDVGRIFRTAGF
jgi:hypothetical protein